MLIALMFMAFVNMPEMHLDREKTAYLIRCSTDTPGVSTVTNCRSHKGDQIRCSSSSENTNCAFTSRSGSRVPSFVCSMDISAKTTCTPLEMTCSAIDSSGVTCESKGDTIRGSWTGSRGDMIYRYNGGNTMRCSTTDSLGFDCRK